jgi:iron complex transport system substrate-binding protein
VRPHRILALAAAAAVTIALAACSTTATGATADEKAAGDGTFPISIKNTYGTTVIESKPKRVAAIAWANHEVPLALGVVPVGMTAVSWGDDDDNGVLPWVEDKLKELGAKTPTLFDETDGIDYEAIANTKPDVILAAYSGITKEQYQTLSKIAPVVSFPKVAWGTSMDDMIRLDAKALGLEKKGDALIASLHAETEKAFAAHPELAGKKVLMASVSPTDTSKIGFYTALDPRPGFLLQYGMTEPSLVTEESKKTKGFYVEVSAEQAERFSDVDVIVTYGDASTLASWQADPLLSKIPAIARGAVAVLPDSTPLAASANPSPLSIGWGITDYVDALAKAANAGK